MNQNNNDLIFGKDNTQNVVALEQEDGIVKLFIQDETTGEIFIDEKPSKYWILCDERPKGRDWIRLKGNLDYHWGRQFSTREDFIKGVNYLRAYNTYSIWDKNEACMVNKGITLFKGLKHNQLSVLSFDLETTGIEHNNASKILIIANTFRDSFGNITRKMFTYDSYNSQAEMLQDWFQWVLDVDPTVICGHNILTFDLPYVQYICKREQILFRMGRNASPVMFNTKESRFRKDGSQFIHYRKVSIYGRQIVDTFFLAIKSDIQRKYESYGLKQIVKQEGMEDPDRQHYDASKIRDNYIIPEEWNKIKKYAEHDGDDSLKLYEKLSAPYFYMCQTLPKTFQQIIESATGSPLNGLLVRSYLQIGHSIPKQTESSEYEGAISFGVPGIYRNAYKQDVAALYPSIMRLKKVHCSIKDPKGNFTKVVDYFTTERLESKKKANETGDKYWRDLEQTQKIVANSLYGMLGAPGLNFNYPEGASLITKTGREILQTAIKFATSKDYTEWIQKDEI